MGCQRSGTTVTGLVLGSHPDCFLVDEDEGAADCLEALVTGDNKRGGSELMSILNAAAHKYQGPEDNSMIRADRSEKRLVLKCINQVYDYDRILRSLPDARVVWLVRDARDVICSMRNVDHPITEKQKDRILSADNVCQLYPKEVSLLRKFGKEDEHLIAAIVWLIKTSLMKHAMKVSEYVFPVKYEKLITNFFPAISDVLQHLGLEFSEAVTFHHKSYQGMAIGNTDRTVPIHKRGIGRWRTELSETECGEIWDLVGEYMVAYGYDNDA